MSNRIILDRLWDSDKLAACSIEAQLHYPRIYLMCDDWACFEIDIVSIQRLAYKKMPGIKRADIFSWLKEYVDHGLLFVWANEHNEFGYWTGAEEERLPSLTRRHKRRTPEPPSNELASYLHKDDLPTEAYKRRTLSLPTKPTRAYEAYKAYRRLRSLRSLQKICLQKPMRSLLWNYLPNFLLQYPLNREEKNQ